MDGSMRCSGEGVSGPCEVSGDHRQKCSERWGAEKGSGESNRRCSSGGLHQRSNRIAVVLQVLPTRHEQLLVLQDKLLQVNAIRSVTVAVNTLTPFTRSCIKQKPTN